MDEMTAAMLAQIQEIEQKDERQVLAELAGETIEEYIYETEVWDWVPQPDGKRKKQKVRKVKLSWVGTREVARSRGNIILSDPIVTDTEDAVRIIVKATDLTRNFSVFGGCHQPKKMKVNDFDRESGEITGSHLEDDPFVFQKGLSKAQRNALNPCIPADYAVKMIDRFLRASGKQPLLAAPGRKGITQKTGQQPARSQIKPRPEWDKITKAQVPDYPTLERLAWDLCKLQPAQMYKELGGGNRNDMTIPAWEAFLTLKERFVPASTAAQEKEEQDGPG
ncbi:MAG: hypothetical protein PHQ43_03750 [Dehalococcoidales bacterium]|nr:hypothetical protein [Dehalococcoidales bacterium]